MPWVDGVHVTLAEGATADDEVRAMVAAIKNDSETFHRQHQDALKALNGTPFTPVPTEQLADIYERMCRLMRLAQWTVDDYLKMPEELKSLKRAVFEQSDFVAVFAGQWLPKEVRAEIRQKLNPKTI